jgi:hypothetical protein
VAPKHGGRDGVGVIVTCKYDIECRAKSLSADDVHVDEKLTDLGVNGEEAKSQPGGELERETHLKRSTVRASCHCRSEMGQKLAEASALPRGLELVPGACDTKLGASPSVGGDHVREWHLDGVMER